MSSIIISLDSHKRYTVAAIEDEKGRKSSQRIEHSHGCIRDFLQQFEPGQEVALETIGSWYWIVDEIEEAGMNPLLVHAGKSKLMMAMFNKTDKLDAEGLNKLQKAGTLPTVWIPPGELRDKRELYRTRMQFVQELIREKNQIHAGFEKYGFRFNDVSDLFGKAGTEAMKKVMPKLPEHTRTMMKLKLDNLAFIKQSITDCEQRMHEAFDENAEMKLVKSIPGIGFILSAVIVHEIGDIHRFKTAEHFASYCGTTPRVHSSGGKTHYGRTSKACNRYLKWALTEAANVTCLNQRNWANRHTVKLYKRVRTKRNHKVAIIAVARHLAEAIFWILQKEQHYKDPALAGLSRQG